MAQIPTIHTIVMADGSEITLETGKLATQADGSVVIKKGGTVILATVVATPEVKEGIDFLPLTVDYREKFAAAGRFPGGFLKRETRPSDYEVLISRLIDRALRPLFPSDYHGDTQVLVTLLSHDNETLPDALACLAASAALSVSDIPFQGPISEVRVAKIDGKLVINPNKSELANATLDLMVAATQKDFIMVEGEMKEVAESEMVEALAFAHEAIKIQCQAQIQLAEKFGKKTLRTYPGDVIDQTLFDAVKSATYQQCYDFAKKGCASKTERKVVFKSILESYTSTLTAEELVANGAKIKQYFHDIEKEAMRRVVLDERTRLDGRKLDQIRPIWSEVGYLPSPHGSAIFTRGETQSLTTVTLGTKLDEQLIDGAFFTGTEKFLLHYNFPPFSTGEVKPMRGTGRREVGHGNLALRALKPLIPADCYYTIRVVSDILESNGSSSMATVCAGTLALMDAGVKLPKHVAGIAMGLITDDKGKYAVLSDILGDEDHLGDMDFKVTGTVDGITACQMDIKVDGLSFEVLKEALEQARKGRLHIIGEMAKTMPQAREDYKPHVPRMVQLTIPKEFIGAVIGPGGKIIQEIQATTGTVITIEEKGDVGLVEISSQDKVGIDKATARIRGIASRPEVGEVYDGKVKSIVAFGAFVEILPGKEGLLHISEIDWKRLETLDGVLKEGDLVKVKLIEIDPKTNKLRLSRKVLLPRPEKAAQ